jgi:hypothetical protein
MFVQYIVLDIHVELLQQKVLQGRSVSYVLLFVCLMSVQGLEMVRFLRWAGSYGHRIGESLAVRSCCCIMQCDRRLSVIATSSCYITRLVSGNSQCIGFWFRRVTKSDT